MPTAQTQRLPAPPLGFSTGHGGAGLGSPGQGSPGQGLGQGQSQGSPGQAGSEGGSSPAGSKRGGLQAQLSPLSPGTTARRRGAVEEAFKGGGRSVGM